MVGDVVGVRQRIAHRGSPRGHENDGKKQRAPKSALDIAAATGNDVAFD
jgi:hypothetical protein